MNGSSPRNLTRLVRISCHVARTDIDAMLDDYDSGMADATRSNAVSRCIRRTCQLDEPVLLVRRRGECPEIRIGGFRVNLEKEVTDWLRKVETGYMPNPLSFELVVPETLSPSEVEVEETIDAQPKTTAA